MAIEYVDATKLDASLAYTANRIRAKTGGSSALNFDLANETGFGNDVDAIPSGGGGGDDGKPVKLIDYDGTVLYSYTTTEFAALTALPANPTHTGLTAQGWNWTLADAKTYVASYGMLTIGQMYNTSDGKTRLYLSVQPDALTVSFRANRPLTGNLDWGDGTVESRTTSTMTHTYAAAGDYVVVINCDVYPSATSLSSYESAGFRQALTKVEIGNKVLISDIFTNCISLMSITIPSGVTAIGGTAFQYCTSLTSITIPSGVTSIGTSAFTNCISLTSAAISSGITSIGSNTFQYCTSLTSITIPSSVTSIGTSAFANCISLTSIMIPSGITSIGNNAFQYCTSLMSITIPSGVTSIGTYAFQYCISLTSVTISSGVTAIGGNAFSNCISLTSITIPNSVTSIGTYAFYYCISLTSVTIPSSVTSLGNYTFTNCISLTSITIPSGVTSIGNSTFRYCASLTSAIIPSSVTSIDSNAFQYCGLLSALVLKPSSPPAAGSSAFAYIPKDCVIHVPAGSLAAYTSASNYPSSSTYTYVEDPA